MYTIRIYNKDWDYIDRIEKFIKLKIEDYLNKESKVSFEVPNIENFRKETFKKKNIVEIFRNWVKIFEGLLIWVKPTATKISVNCESYSHILKYRFVNNTFTWGYDNVISSIFSDWLFTWPIPVNLKLQNLTWNISLELFNKNVLDCLKTIEKSWKDYLFRWKDLIISDLIWEDKSWVIELKFLEYRSSENNIKNISIDEDWITIVNSVFWYKDWLTPVLLQDIESINDYWVYSEAKNFSEAEDQLTLEKLTQWYLEENKRERLSVNFNVENTKLDVDLVNIWDVVNVKIKKWYIDVNTNLRIVWKIFDVKWETNFWENIDFVISDWRKEILDFFESINDIKNRVDNLEK